MCFSPLAEREQAQTSAQLHVILLVFAQFQLHTFLFTSYKKENCHNKKINQAVFVHTIHTCVLHVFGPNGSKTNIDWTIASFGAWLLIFLSCWHVLNFLDISYTLYSYFITEIAPCIFDISAGERTTAGAGEKYEIKMKCVFWVQGLPGLSLGHRVVCSRMRRTWGRTRSAFFFFFTYFLMLWFLIIVDFPVIPQSCLLSCFVCVLMNSSSCCSCFTDIPLTIWTWIHNYKLLCSFYSHCIFYWVVDCVNHSY